MEIEAVVDGEIKSVEVDAAPVPPEAVQEDTLLFATSKSEMERAQAASIDWFEAKLVRLRKKKQDIDSELEIAVKNKWKTVSFKASASQKDGEITYYEKILAALKDGYCIFPATPVNLIAVRRNAAPQGKMTHRDWEHPAFEQSGEPLRIGAGHYFSNLPHVKSLPAGAVDGKDMVTSWPSAMLPVEVPVVMRKPILMEALSNAQKAMVFDEIGIVQAPVRRDPILVGRILGKRKGWNQPVTTFLICWWLDLETI